ncbi:MAG: hypothetical protein C5B55_06420 [Blastocatellia bacterium]|nr:MAG: hypothetical protein C5B55_06420 [Blastocatellia bacterium]
MILFALSLDNWMNYPGLELWKFINLAIFLSAAIFVLKQPLANALRARRERIVQELLKAKEDKEAATRRLSEAEDLLSHVDGDVKAIREQTVEEAKSERERLAQLTQMEIEKLEGQGKRQVDIARRVARKGLREFLARRSVELASATVNERMRPDVDERLIGFSITELRRGRS